MEMLLRRIPKKKSSKFNKKVNKIVESKKISAVKKIKTVNIKKKRHIVGADPS